MSELLSRKQIIEQVGAPKSTVGDWINEYKLFLPIVTQGARTYYKQETVDILKAVKSMREQDVSKTQIAEQLAVKFPVNVDEVVSEIEQARSNPEANDAMIAVMATVGKVIEQLDRQEAELKKLRDEVAASKEETEQLRIQINAMKEEKSKGIFRRLFGGK